MTYGIAILGLNGAGKSTLAYTLAKKLDFFNIDAEDYYFPEQKESRVWALEHSEIIPTQHLGDLPFSFPRSKDEVEKAILRDMEAHQKFVISTVRINMSDAIISRINIAFLLDAPPDERLRRLRQREEKRFGKRVMQDGDMHNQQLEFEKLAAARDVEFVKESLKRLRCPVVALDGLAPVSENLEKIVNYLSFK